MRRWILELRFLFFLGCFAATAQQSFEMRVKPVEIAEIGKDSKGSLYRVHIEYSTEPPNEFILEGFGRVKDRGELQFLSHQLELRYGQLGTPPSSFVRAPLSPTVVAAGTTDLLLPNPAQFVTGRDLRCNCVSEAEMPLRANSILNKYFLNGYIPIEMTAGRSRLLTHRRGVSVPRPFVVRAAMLIEYPHRIGNALAFRVSWLVEESRTGSDEWIPMSNGTVQSKWEAFQGEVERDLTGALQ